MVERRARRGDGSVYWSKSMRRWIAKHPKAASRRRFRTEPEAVDQLREWRRLYGRSERRFDGTLGEWLAEWLPAHSRSVRPSTATSYAGHVRLHISPLLGGIPLAELRPSDIRRLVADCAANGLSPGTTHLVIRTLSVALNAAESDGVLDRSPTRGVRLPRLERPGPAAMTRDDADVVLAAVVGTWLWLPVRALLGSGLRAGELCGLDQGDLVLPALYVRVRLTKTQPRAVPVTRDAAEALTELLRAAPRVGPGEPVLFGPRTGERLRVGSLSHAFGKALQDAGLPPMRVHDLRHGVATMMLTKGSPMRAIADQLGHRNPSMTARVYAHVVPEVQRRSLDAIDESQTG
jgi:integrase